MVDTIFAEWLLGTEIVFTTSQLIQHTFPFPFLCIICLLKRAKATSVNRMHFICRFITNFTLSIKFLACWCTWTAFLLLHWVCFWKVKPTVLSLPNILFTYWKSDNSKQDNPPLSFRGGFTFKNSLSSLSDKKQMIAELLIGFLDKGESSVCSHN